MRLALHFASRIMAGLKVFGPAMSTSVARVLLCLEEVGAEYELVPVDVLAGEHKGPNHVKLNPFGLVPAFQDGDLVLYESRAIMRYILRKYTTNEVDLLRECNIKEAAMVDVWTEVEAHQYYPALSAVVHQYFNPSMYGIPTDQKVVEQNLEKVEKILEIYEEHLSSHKYLAGDFISFADLNHFPITYYFMATPHASVFDLYPHVKAWCVELLSRPSIQKLSANMPITF